MRVIVFGATGKTGRHILSRALEQGHEVTAFGRSVDRLDAESGLRLSRGDVFDSDVVEKAVAGHDAVIVSLGSTGLRDRTTLAGGTANIIDAACSGNIRRLVVVSAAGVGGSWAQIPWSSRLMFKTMLRNVFADHQSQEALVERSSANWTIVRSAVLTDKPATGAVIAANTGATKRISRADLAGFLVEQLTDDSYIRQAISITS
ncbi:NAD(P)-dependent oxidoreductase [Candidatus Poriferisocius sp.]|uniref:NAD(P)-dependent oxidoreductase n=1 Tax=Candidatus Poriferisocius sp. TaxID=3101276 RepID=UPI003B017346